MKRFLREKWTVLTAILVAALSLGTLGLVHAEDESESEEPTAGQISISISPVTEEFQLNSNSMYEGVLNVTNAGSEPFDFEVFSAPYSFSMSETNNGYTPNYTNENSYTQIARWITIKDQAGNYVSSVKDEEGTEHPTFSAAPGETVAVEYRINTPDNIPAGGQYAALFAQTLPKESNSSGINALANLGMKVFGRSEEGEAVQSADIYDLAIKNTIEKETDVEENGQTVQKTTTLGHINASAMVKNTGNLDFSAKGVLKVTDIFGAGVYYETPEGAAQVSIIPESELPISDEWQDTPSIGLYRVNWTVTAGEDVKSIETVILLMPPYVIIITIILLTIIIVWIIMMVRRRKERRSRFTV